MKNKPAPPISPLSPAPALLLLLTALRAIWLPNGQFPHLMKRVTPWRLWLHTHLSVNLLSLFTFYRAQIQTADLTAARLTATPRRCAVTRTHRPQHLHSCWHRQWAVQDTVHGRRCTMSERPWYGRETVLALLTQREQEREAAQEGFQRGNVLRHVKHKKDVLDIRKNQCPSPTGAVINTFVRESYCKSYY